MFWKLLVSVVCGLFAVLCLQVSPVAAERIKVGWIGDTSGPFKGYGFEIRKGTEFAVKEINEKGGVRGKKLVLVYTDSSSIPDKAAGLARNLVTSERVVAILGDYYTGATSTSATAVTDLRIPQIAFMRGVKFRQLKSPYLFGYTPSKIVHYDAIVGYAVKDLRLKNLGVMLPYYDEKKGVSALIENYTKQIGLGKIVAKQVYAPAALDFTSRIKQLQRDKPDAVVLTGSPLVTGLIARQVTDINWKVKLLSADFNVGLKGFVEQAQAGAENILMASAFAIETTKPEFAKKWKDKFGAEPNRYNVMGYDTLKIVTAALSAVGEDPAKITDYLRKERFDTVSGISRVSLDWHIDRMFIRKWEAGSLKTVAEYNFTASEKAAILKQEDGGVIDDD